MRGRLAGGARAYFLHSGHWGASAGLLQLAAFAIYRQVVYRASSGGQIQMFSIVTLTPGLQLS